MTFFVYERIKMNYKNRSAVPSEYKWDLTKWFKTDEAWEEKFLEASKKINILDVYKGKLFEEDNLYNALKLNFEYENELEKLYAYAMLKQDEDLAVSKYGKMYNQILNLFNKYSENTSYIMPELLHFSEFNVEKLIEKTPKLKRYEQLLKEIELEKKYVKDEKTEKIISLLLSDIHNHDNISNNLLNSDIFYGKITDELGEKVELTSGNSSKYLTSSDRKLRKNVYNKMNDQRMQFSSTLGKNLIAYMSRKSNYAKVRGYNSSIDMFFESSQIPFSVYEKLLKEMRKGFGLQRKYYDLYKDYLGLKTLEIYDLNAPIISSEKKYSVQDAKKMFISSVKVLGDEYTSIAKLGFEENWVDFYPYKGKTSGGYCMGIYGVTSNICMNYNDNYKGISTLAHEMGHAINFYYANQNNIEDSRHSNYIAEIPSLLNEILLANYVIENSSSKEEKCLVINNLLKTFNTNFFGATMESELENIVYRKLDKDEAVSSDDLNEIMMDLQKEYYGDSVKLNKYSPYLWTSRSHYFIPWYLYKYSTCLLGAVYYASKILKGDKEALKTYLEFLKAPNNTFPDEILKHYNINLNEDKIYEEFFEYYDSLLEKLKENMK